MLGNKDRFSSNRHCPQIVSTATMCGSHTHILYSGKLLREKTFANWLKNTIFAEKTFTDCSLLPCRKVPSPQNFTAKTFVDSHKTAKFAKVFSLESFPLYGM